MLYLVFCLTEGKFRDIRNEFDYDEKTRKFVDRQESDEFLKDYKSDRFWEIHQLHQLKLLFTFRGDYHLLSIEKISFLEISGRIVKAHLDDSETVQTYAQFKGLEESLGKIGFIRISRFFIVSIRHICAIQGGEVRLVTGERLPIGRKYKKALKVVLVEKTLSVKK